MNGNNPDHLPNNPSEHLDNDGDGTGDNADLDDDNDGINDGDDTWPFDPCVWRDTDGDGMADEVASDCTTTVNDDPDNDDDTMLDQNDFCPSGDTGWQSGAVTDYDLDGCQDVERIPTTITTASKMPRPLPQGRASMVFESDSRRGPRRLS